MEKHTKQARFPPPASLCFIFLSNPFAFRSQSFVFCFSCPLSTDCCPLYATLIVVIVVRLVVFGLLVQALMLQLEIGCCSL